MLRDWVRNNIAHFGIGNVILSGGVAQNIKAVKALAEMDCVEHIWAGPISGDGSIGVGAAWLACRKLAPKMQIAGLTSIYLGTQHDSRAVEQAIDARKLNGEFSIIERPTTDQAACWLDAGHVVARFSGRMEFGQRALGNRSILADPRRAASVEKVNTKIKYRDFWMPFTPSMTDTAADKMLVNPKKHYSPYMTMAFDLNPGFADALPAVVHPADKTARAQMLRREDNPGYYELMQAFGRRSGYECVMNTSFNLHGDAIAESPDDAVRTFLESGLDVLLFDDIAVGRVELGEAGKP